MTEPTQSSFQDKLKGRDLRIGAVAVAAIILLISAAAAIGASPAPSGDPGATTAPASAEPDVSPRDKSEGRWLEGFAWRGRLGPGPDGHGFGFHGLGAISITRVAGSNVSLETDNGWTRTIAVTDAVTITKGGQEIALADLAVGDRIALREDRAEDGTYTVTDIVVLLPTVAGEVSAKTANSITVTQRDGSSATIHVDANTTYRVAGQENATLADITVGMIAIAQGTERADGSLDAVAVRAGLLRRGFDGDGPGFPWRDGPWWPGALPAPDASPAPDA